MKKSSWLVVLCVCAVAAFGASGYTVNKDESILMTRDEAIMLKVHAEELQQQNIDMVFQIDGLIRELKAERSKLCI